MKKKEKTERRLSQIPFPVRGPITRLLINLGKNEEFKKSGLRMSLYQTRQSLDQVSRDWGKGRTRDDFYNIDLGSRAKYASPKEKKVIHTERPQDFGLYNGIGARCYLSEKKKPLDKDFIFPDKTNQYLYDLFQKEAINSGFRAYGVTYGRDYGYIELPVLEQDGNNCYIYAVVNCLQKHIEKFRTASIEDCALAALKLEDEIRKGYDLNGVHRPRLRSVETVLDILIEKRMIAGFKKIKPQTKNDWYDLIGKPVILTNNNSYKDNDRILEDDITDGSLIDGHAVCYGTTRAEGVYVINSWRKFPVYLVSNYDSIDNIYLLEGEAFEN